MIVAMKKVFIIVEPSDAQEAVSDLRSIGVVHVEHQQSPSGKDIASLKDDIAILDKVSDILASPDLTGKSGIKEAKLLKDWRFAAKHIIDTYARIDQLIEYGLSLKVSIATWHPWGDFDPMALRSLEDKGVFVRLYEVPVRELASIAGTVMVKTISIVQGLAYCAVVSREKIQLPFKEVIAPKIGLAQMRARLEENEHILAALRDTIRKYTCYAGRFHQIRNAFMKELEFHEALKGMGSSSGVVYLAGYAPAESTAALISEAKSKRWGISVTDPSDDDIVPTLVRNPRWVSLINPVFRLIEIVPGYKELDISFWFLLFISIFFGMLIGDAGYGAAFLGLTVLAHMKFGKKMRDKSLFHLFYVLSSFAIVWGLLTGTIFGQGWLPGWYKPLIPALRNDKTIQELCFLIGAVHLSIAHLWRAILKAPSPAALADVGWTAILWGGFFLARVLVLGQSFPSYGGWFFIVGSLLVVFFTSPKRNILKAAGEGLGALALSFVNTFTDIVSYIRLFAVGLATVAVADSFNQMAIDVGFGSVLSGFVAAFILLIGHGLNIVLGPMSVLVHGVRLNILEFCSHLDIKWSGFYYKPLKQ